MTKICTKCGVEKSITEFHYRNREKGTLRSECKVCHNDYVKGKYQERKNVVQEIKTKQKCQKCGDARPYVLDFHHTDPSVKHDTVARLTANNSAMDRVRAEIDKCIVLCANCHREFHEFEKQSTITIEEYIRP